MSSVDLFGAAGLPLPPIPAKPPRKVRKPSPAALAASGRLEGARRSRPTVRDRVGMGRDLMQTGQVVAFPFSKNAKVLATITARLPSAIADNIEDVFDHERNKYARRLIARGWPKLAAKLCASELLHKAYMTRVKEAGIL